MMGLPLGFAQPLVLLGLLSLPVLWWILRLIPPRPRRVEFPPTRLLFDIKPKEDTPARTPWWLTLLRLTLATLVILAAAGPLWNPPVATTTGATPIALLIDDGFGAAASWDARLRTADDIVARAEADNRGVALIPLGEASRDISLQPPAAARVRLKQLKPTAACRRAHRRAADDLASARRQPRHGGDLALRRHRSRPRLGIRHRPGARHRRPHRLRRHRRAADRACARRRRQCRGRADGEGAARLDRRHRGRHHPRARPERPAARRDALRLQGRRPRDRRRDQPAGRDQERHRAAGDRRRALGRRGATARQALAPPHRRRRLRLDLRHRAAAARLDLLSVARAQPVRRRAAGRCRGRPPRRCAASSSRTCR